MKHSKSIGLGLTVIAMAVSPLTAAPAANPAQKLYDAKCASCHGKDGKGKPPMAKVFKIDPSLLDMTAPATVQKSDEDLAKLIANGKNKMPGFAKQMKAEEIKSLVQYLRSLAPVKK